MCKHTFNELKKIKYDSLLEKRKHYNAAVRFRRYHYFFGGTAAVLNLFLGSYLARIFKIAESNVLGAILAFIASFLILFQTLFKFSPQAKQHEIIGNRYLSLNKKCRRMISLYEDKGIDLSDLSKQIEDFAKLYDEIIFDSVNCPTNYADYKKAKKGIENGEEIYTNNELNLN